VAMKEEDREDGETAHAIEEIEVGLVARHACGTVAERATPRQGGW
jgi:hypothetical protein